MFDDTGQDEDNTCWENTIMRSDNNVIILIRRVVWRGGREGEYEKESANWLFYTYMMPLQLILFVLSYITNANI